MIKFKNLAIKIKILLDRLSTGVDMVEDRTNELEDKPIEFSYLNNQKEIDWKKKIFIRALEIFGTLTNNEHLYMGVL